MQVVSLGLPLGKAMEFIDKSQQFQQREQCQEEQQHDAMHGMAVMKLGEGGRVREPLAQRNV